MALQDAWGNFQEGLKSALNQWTALQLAVENNWGGGDSQRKVVLLQEGLINLFRTKKELYKDEVDDFLGDFLDDNFSTYAEDDSPAQVAAMLVEMFAQCGRLDYTLANAVRAEEQRLLLKKKSAVPGSRGAVASSVSAKGGLDEDESSSNDEDDDMGGGAEGGEAAKAAAAGPDADGWETVTTKKGGKGGRR